MEQLKAQSADNVKRMEVEQKERDSQRDAEIEKYKADIDAQVKLALANVQAELADKQAQTSMALEAQKGEQTAGIEHLRASLNPKSIEAKAKAEESATASEVLKALAASQEQQTQIILAAFSELTKAMSAPREFVRDKAGKAVGSRIAAA
jgi:hypothetical protein